MSNEYTEMLTEAAEKIHARFEHNMTHNDDGEEVEYGESGHSAEECMQYALEEACENDGVIVALEPECAACGDRHEIDRWATCTAKLATMK